MAVPGVSVVIPVFNRAATVERAVRSVLEQSPPVLEVLVIDDGSTDETARVVGQIAAQDSRIRYVRQPHAGANAARNRGIELAEGTLVAFQDSDDEWLPGKLQAQLTARQAAGGPALVFCRQAVHEPGRPCRLVPDGAVPPGGHRRQLLRENHISTQTVLVDKALLAASAGFDPVLRRLQDWDLWLGMLRQRRQQVVLVPKVLVNVYRQPDSISEDDPAYYAALERIVRKHWPLLAAHPYALLRHLYRIARGRLAGAMPPWLFGSGRTAP